MLSVRRFLAVAALASVLLCLSAAPTAALNANCSAADPINTCIRIGYFRLVASGVQVTTITGYNEMMQWYIDRINIDKGGMIAGIPVRFVAYVVSSVAPATAALRLATALWAPTGGVKKVDFVILPSGSNWAESSGGAMLALEKAQIPAIAANSPLSSLYQCPSNKTLLASFQPCSTVGSRRYQYAHGISNAGEQYFQPWIGLLKLKKAQTVAVIQTGAASTIYPTVTQGIINAAADYAINVVYTSATANATVAQADMDRVMQQLIALQPDGVALATTLCAPWINAFKQADYMPASLSTMLCTDSDATAAALGDSINFVVGTAQWNPNMNGNDYLENSDEQPWTLFPHKANGQLVDLTSPKQFVRMWQKITNSTNLPGYAEASILSAFTMLEGAIELTMRLGGSVPDPVLVNQQLQLYYQPSYFGILSTNRYGENQQKALVINQRDATGVLGVISPASSAMFDFIYPAPKFSERVYVQKMLDTPVEFIVIALLCLASLFTFSLMSYLFMKRNHQVFQAAGLPFYLLMGFGCIVAFGSVLTWGVENNAQTCNARIWLWTICFHMFVDPLLASSWRISRIFSQKLQTVKLTNRMVGAISLVVFAPQLIINILWQSIAPLEPKIITSEILRPAHTSFTTCSGGDAGLIFTGATLGYSALLLVTACYLAYKVRRAYRLFNDARPIAMSMYIFTVTAAIILVIQIALNTDDVSAQKVLFGLRSIGVIIAYQSSLALLYFRRILGQVDVSKYGGKPGTESDDTTASSRVIGTKGVPGKAITDGSNGKMMFQKGEGSAKGETGTGSLDDNGAVRNVHVHIQPPNGNGTSTGTHTPDGTDSPNLAAFAQRGMKSNGVPSPSPSRSSPTVGMSSLQLENLSNTPKLGGFNARPRPTNLGNIVNIPAAIPLPSQAELMAMDNAQLSTLVQQFHAQNQVLRSQLRSQNLQTAAAARGEVHLGGTSHHASLPGTPDRSPRLTALNQQQGQSTPEGASRRPSYIAAALANESYPSPTGDSPVNELVQLRHFGQADSDAVAVSPAFTRQNSELASERDSPTGSNSSPKGASSRTTVATHVANVEVSPVTTIEAGALEGQ